MQIKKLRYVSIRMTTVVLREGGRIVPITVNFPYIIHYLASQDT
jgi:hypothetical protein